MDKTYNGWSSRDTWLVNLYINNDEGNYYYIRDLMKKADLELMSDDEILDILVGLNYNDEINFDNVNIDEVREILEEI